MLVDSTSQIKLWFMKTKLVFQLFFAFMMLEIIQLKAQVGVVSSDSDWTRQQVSIKNSSEADFIIRLGDVDNLGFG